MPSAVYVSDDKGSIPIRFRTEEEKERFKAHYRLLDALGVQASEERDEALALAERQAGEIERLRKQMLRAEHVLEDALADPPPDAIHPPPPSFSRWETHLTWEETEDLFDWMSAVAEDAWGEKGKT